MLIQGYRLLIVLSIAMTPSIASAAALESGEELFQDYCAQCHGEDGRGGGELVEQRLAPLPDLRKADHAQ